MKKPSTQIERLKYIEILMNEFVLRRREQHFYSLRAFAHELSLDPIHLSRILRSQKGLSRRKAEIIARKLTHLNYAERRNFIRLVSAASGRSLNERNMAKMALKNETLELRFKKRS